MSSIHVMDDRTALNARQYDDITSFSNSTSRAPHTVDFECSFLVMAVTTSKFECHLGPGAFIVSLGVVLKGSAIGTNPPQGHGVSPHRFALPYFHHKNELENRGRP